MTKSFVAILLFGTSIVASEFVWLEDATDDNNRNLDGGLPSSLKLNLKRNDKTIPLDLEENTGLNARAPVYGISENGLPTLKETYDTLDDVKFYLDKRSGGHFSASCVKQREGRCKRYLRGNLYIDQQSYNIYPDETLPEQEQEIKRNAVLRQGKSSKRHQLEARTKVKRQSDDKILSDKKAVELNSPDMLLGVDVSRSKKDQKVKKDYGVETVVITDAYVWEWFYNLTDESDVVERYRKTENDIKQYTANVINGVDLRLKSIEENDFSLHTTIRAYIIQDDIRSDPFNLRGASQEPLYHIDSSVYLYKLRDWVVANAYDLPESDHVMLFTGLTLRSITRSEKRIPGRSYLNGICGVERVSVVHIGDFFTSTFVAAHELGHNLGAEDDGTGSASSCHGLYVMHSSVPTFYNVDDYTIEPWRFSTCSIQAFRDQLQRTSSLCLKDEAEYDVTYEEMREYLPGQIYDANDQCQLLWGKESSLCPETDNDSICSMMKCKVPGSVYYCKDYIAAYGTDCDEKGGKWCQNGQCVLRAMALPRTGPEPESLPEGCVDEGQDGNTCQDLLNEFDGVKYKMCLSFSSACCASCYHLHIEQSPPARCVDTGLNDYFTCARLKEQMGESVLCKQFNPQCCRSCWDVCGSRNAC